MPLAETSATAATPCTLAGSIADARATLAEFFDRFSCEAKNQAMDSLATTELTFSQLRVLFAVASHDSVPSVQQIADIVKLSLPSAGRTVEGLVQLGVVDRREDPDDRRIKRISLTTEGEHVVSNQLTIRQELINDFLDRLPTDLRDNLTAALHPIVDAAVDYFTPSSSSHPGSSNHPGSSSHPSSTTQPAPPRN